VSRPRVYPTWRQIARLEAGVAAEMGADSLVIGVTVFSMLYAVLLPSPWLALLGPVAFVLIIEVFERARGRSALPRRGAWDLIAQQRRQQRAARVNYVLWGVAALLAWLAAPGWAALLYVPWLATVPWLLLMGMFRQRMTYNPPSGPAGPAGVREPRRPRPSSGSDTQARYVEP
jgi:hypothetical protein